MRLTPHMWCAALQVNLAKMVAKQPGPPIELNTITDLFLQRNAVREATAFLLDALQDNKPEHALLQTKVRTGVVVEGRYSGAHFRGDGALFREA